MGGAGGAEAGAGGAGPAGGGLAVRVDAFCCGCWLWDPFIVQSDARERARKSQGS